MYHHTSETKKKKKKKKKRKKRNLYRYTKDKKFSILRYIS